MRVEEFVHFSILGAYVVIFILIPIVGLMASKTRALSLSLGEGFRKIYAFDYDAACVSRFSGFGRSFPMWIHPSLPGNVRSELESSLLKRAGLSGKLGGAIMFFAFAPFLVRGFLWVSAIQSAFSFSHDHFNRQWQSMLVSMGSFFVALMGIPLYSHWFIAIARKKAHLVNSASTYVKWSELKLSSLIIVFEAHTNVYVAPFDPPCPPKSSQFSFSTHQVFARTFPSSFGHSNYGNSRHGPRHSSFGSSHFGHSSSDYDVFGRPNHHPFSVGVGSSQTTVLGPPPPSYQV